MPSRSAAADGLACMGLVLLVAVGFWRTLFAEFVFLDDPQYVSLNPEVQQGLTWNGVIWACTTFKASNWHPLVWLSLMLDRTLFGPQPWGFHLTNVALHAANTSLLYLALRMLTGEIARPVLVAALFAIHPQHVESVAWVSERKDTLSTLFWMLGLVAYARWARQRTWLAWVAVWLALAIGLTAKQMLVTFPCVLVLLDIWPLRRWDWWERTWIVRSDSDTPSAKSRSNQDALGQPRASLPGLLREKWTLLVPVVAGCLLVIAAQQSGGSVADLGSLPLTERLRQAATSYAMYLVLMLWPVPLACLYPYDYCQYGWAGGWLAALVLGGLTYAAVRASRRTPAVLVGWLWYLGTLVPVIGLVHVGVQAIADRYTYIPLVGIFLSLTWLLPMSIRGERGLSRGWIGAFMLVPMLTGITIWQTGFWQNDLELFTRCAQVTRHNSLAHYVLSIVHEKAGDRAEMIRQLELAREHRFVTPQLIKGLIRLGTEYVAAGQLDQAGDVLRQAVAEAPQSGKAHYELAGVYLRQEHRGEALTHYLLTTRCEPTWPEGHFQVGTLLAQADKFREAIPYFEQAASLKPDWVAAHHSLGLAKLLAGDREGARRSLQRALAIEPGFAPAAQLLEELQGTPAR